MVGRGKKKITFYQFHFFLCKFYEKNSTQPWSRWLEEAGGKIFIGFSSCKCKSCNSIIYNNILYKVFLPRFYTNIFYQDFIPTFYTNILYKCFLPTFYTLYQNFIPTFYTKINTNIYTNIHTNIYTNILYKHLYQH